MLAKGFGADSYTPVSPEDVPSDLSNRVHVITNEASLLHHRLPASASGIPSRKPLFNPADCIAVLLSLVCFAIGVCTISPSLGYAARLQYTRQIIVLGALLGIMNQCLQRIITYTFLLIEARFGRCSLQNFDGLLRLAPLADGFDLVWRSILVLLLVLPLALGVVYKRFTGGTGVLHVVDGGTLYSPTVPYGLSNVGPLTAVANATGRFMASSGDEFAAHFEQPQPFGYNVILLSNTSAAAIDAPNQLYVKQLQHDIDNDAFFALSAKVRGTVATYNNTAETHRHDQSFWDKYYSLVDGLQSTHLLAATGTADEIGLLNIFSARGDTPEYYNTSWAFLGLYNDDNGDTDPKTTFNGTALGFDIKRHNCEVEWKITKRSMELSAGKCDAHPLAWQYQYLENCQLYLQGSSFLPILDEYLGPFSGERKASTWKLPTYLVATATLFWSRVALQDGAVNIQVNGPLQQYWQARSAEPDTPFEWNETYHLDHELLRVVPTLDPAATLYLILGIQPLMTVFAFIAALLMYKIPIGRGFGLVSILAGADKDSLEQLDGAGFSGKLANRVSLGIKVKSENVKQEHVVYRVEYALGQNGDAGGIRSGTRYH